MRDRDVNKLTKEHMHHLVEKASRLCKVTILNPCFGSSLTTSKIIVVHKGKKEGWRILTKWKREGDKKKERERDRDGVIEKVIKKEKKKKEENKKKEREK